VCVWLESTKSTGFLFTTNNICNIKLSVHWLSTRYIYRGGQFMFLLVNL